MRALEYATKFKNEGSTIEALGRVVFDMMVEVRTIMQSRKAQSDATMLAVLDEQHAKFKAFHRQTEGKISDGTTMHPSAFARMIRRKMPDIFAYWNLNRGGRLLSD